MKYEMSSTSTINVIENSSIVTKIVIKQKLIMMYPLTGKAVAVAVAAMTAAVATAAVAAAVVVCHVSGIGEGGGGCGNGGSGVGVSGCRIPRGGPL
jgi:hypothetical protein